MFKERSGQPFELFANSRYRNHFVYLALFIMYLPMAWLGFHPHHEGLMLATLNLTADALAQNLPIPFNQYGYLWMLPFLPFNFLPLNGYAFLAQRLTSILLIFVSAFLVHKISRFFFSMKISIILTFFFLTTYSYGQPSILWPSIPAQTSLLFLTYSILRFFQEDKQKYLLIASISSVMIIGSRIQIGIAAVFATILLLQFTKIKKHSWRYIFYVSTLLVAYALLLNTRGYLKFAVYDSLLFPFEYLDRNQSNWTLPRTSIAIATIFLSLLVLLYRFGKNRKLFITIALGNIFFALLFLFAFYDNLQLFHFLFSRTYVAGILLLVFVLLSYLFQTIPKVKLHSSREQALFIYGLVGSIQLFPLFDAFHFWYASAPLIITFPLIIKKIQLCQKLTKPIVTKFLYFNLSILGILFSLQSGNAYMTDSQPFSLKQVKGVHLSGPQYSDFKNEFALFKFYIPQYSKVFNLCPNADPYFERRYWISASRYFVFWPSFDKAEFLKEAISNSDYITSCIQMDMLDSVSKEFVKSNFEFISEGTKLQSWGISWEIYKRVEK